MKTICIIPAYNEERNVRNVVENAQKFVDEVVVVDDHSEDNTLKEAEKTSAFVLHHPVNRGQGAAIQTGNEFALDKEADIIVHFDADGQFLPEEIKEIVAPIIKGEADVCLGSRFLGKSSDLPFLKKNFILPAAKVVNRTFFGIRTTDPQNGFRALSGQVTENIEIEQDQMAHCSEILYKIHQQGCRIKEIPITVIYHEYGQRFTGGIKIIKDMVIKGLMTR